MNQFYEMQGRMHSALLQVPSVEIPKPKAPTADDVVEQGNALGDWLTLRSQTFWAIVICLVLAFLVGKAMKRPMVKGAAVGLAVALVVAAIINN